MFYDELKKYFNKFRTTSDELRISVNSINGAATLNVVTTPSGSSEQVALNADATIDADTSASSVSNRGYSSVGAQIDIDGLNNLDGSIKLQESIDGVSYVDIVGASVNLNANATFIITNSLFSGQYVRGVYNHGTNTLDITYDNLVGGPFQVGETVTDGITGATGIVVNDDGISLLSLSNIVGTFSNNDGLTGGTSGTTADVDGTPTPALYTVTLFFK